MGTGDKVPVIDQEKEQKSANSKKKFSWSLLTAIGVSCALVATLIVLVVVGSVYISDLQNKVNGKDNGEVEETSAKEEWERHQQNEKIRRVKTNHPEMTVEAEQVWLETKDTLNLGHISAKPVAIYRKDLDEDYVAYWEITVNHTEYVIISAGKRTGDWKRVAQGNLPSMTQFANKIAQDYGKTCFSYYMMTPSGEIMCDNNHGRIVATTIDDEITTDSKDTDRHKYVENHLPALEVTWVKHAYDVSNHGEWDDFDVSRNNTAKFNGPDPNIINNDDSKDKEDFFESAAVPGHPIIIAVGKVKKLIDLNIRYLPNNANVTIESIRRTQFNLCQCSDICDDQDKYAVKRSHIKVDNDTGLGYLKFEICKTARHIFNGTEISFVIEISSNDGTVIKKRFGLEFESLRRKRWTQYGSWSRLVTSSIPYESKFPDYNQFSNGNCYVGCASVAWAQVFGYFDKRSHYTSRYGTGSRYLYRSGSDGTTGSSSSVAPDITSDSRIKGYIKYLAKTLNTFCLSGQGATVYTNMDRVSGFFKARQRSGYPVIYQRSWAFSLVGGNSKYIADWALKYVTKGWPVIVGVHEGSIFKLHYAVATEVRYRYRLYRTCHSFIWATYCYSWRKQYKYEMYTHQGWGGRSNRWRTLEAWYAVVAKY